MKSFPILFLSILFLGLPSFALAQKGKALPLNSELQNKAAVVAVNQANTIAVYAKGLCCPSCAIGVRRHLSRLPFIDRKRFKSGVHLDVKAQLASIAIKPGAKADHAALAKAISKAGYEPVRVFEKRGADVIATPLFGGR